MPPEWFTSWRNGQAEAVDEIVGHFNRGVPLVVLDAPTGVGKTLIGESVRARLGLRGVYLCSSLTLQDQFAEDFPDAKVLKGRSNYRPLMSQGRWRSVTCADCDKTTINGVPACTYCDPVWACPYEVAKAEALGANLTCTNTRYFLTEANLVGRLTQVPLAVLDECDLMESELMGFIEARVSNAMRKLLNLGMPKKKTVQSSWVEWLNRAIPKVQSYLETIVPEPGTDDVLARRRYTAVSRLLADLQRVAPRVREGGWIYTGYGMGDVAFSPIRVDEYGQQYLWRHASRWLCMSATVVSPEEFVASLGWEGPWECVQMDSPFDVARRPIYYAPVANMKHSAKDDEWPKMAEGIKKVLDNHPNERVLVHTNSYALSAFIESRITSPRIRTYLDRADREAAINWFEDRPDGVLLASSLDRGYDGIDDKCRVVVVAKLPYPNLGDRQISARLYSKGGGTWYAVQVARSLVQMAGRGMRHENDWCSIVILDQQFERFWREWRRGVGRHGLLPSWFSDALVWGGRYRQQLVRS